ncbi:ATP-binding protein [Couchioplanes caeruleus]|uniref:ATP-binding protein n=1 Tax=Couchioplanes caeruleus TaxID=56438 RepID=UPI0020C06E09|nr:ATP-binding protein [Couchioplanes caeruleus]UQU65927.1 ATP-binding protein [Couchioplanes caeruleus]
MIRGRLPSEDIGTEVLISETFDRSRVAPLRHAVAARAGAAGLTGDRLDDFVVAVNELLTNAVRHGGGTGHLTLWCEACAVTCEVVDSGAGVGQLREEKPAPDEPGGWGLYLVRELTDTFAIKSGPEGTAVRISSRVTG